MSFGSCSVSPGPEKRSADSVSVRLKSNTSHSSSGMALHPSIGHCVAAQPVAAGQPKPGSPSTAFHALFAHARFSSECETTIASVSEVAELLIQPVVAVRASEARHRATS